MAVNTSEIMSVFDTMIAKIKEVLDAEYDAERLTSDLYAKALISSMQQTMQLATSTVQQQPVLEAQVTKTEADTAFVTTQDTELTNSVGFNNKIKALDAYGDMIGTMGAGSLNISTDMWTTFFSMVNDLNAAGTIPASTTVTKLT